MYDNYYTGSDVNVYLYYPLTDKRVHIDKAMGIGYNHSISTAPVYILGNGDPAFFTRGNSLVQGNLDLAHKSIKYLKTGISYLLSKAALNDEKADLYIKVRDNSASKEEVLRYCQLQNELITDMSTISISEIFHEFELIIEFNNTNSNKTGVTESVVLEGLKFNSSSTNVYSTEESVLVDRLTFMAKNLREL